MALEAKSLILYGFEVTEFNQSIDFQNVALGPTIMATLNLGFYSASGLCEEIARAMFAADGTNIYSCSVDRTIGGGLQNRLTVSTSGSFLSLLFGSGPRAASSAAPLMGFNSSDYTGATMYTGSTSTGTPLIPDLNGYNYLGPEFYRKVFGSVHVSASGLKEAIVFQIQRFIQVEFKYEPKAKVISEWLPFWDWAIQQKPFEFTPEVSSPTVFYDVSLEKTDFEGKGLGFMMKELLPQFPNLYRTGTMQLRVKPT